MRTISILFILPLLVFYVNSTPSASLKASQARLKLLKHLINTQASIRVQAARALRNNDNVNEASVDVEHNLNAARQWTENDVNDAEDYFNGDNEITNGQVDSLYLALQQYRRQKRGIGGSKTEYIHLWSSTQISYDFHQNVPEFTRDLIRKAIDVWTTNTCLNFIENGSDENRIRFVDGKGCASYVGMVGGIQYLSIKTPDCAHVGMIVHEIGHALGVNHEQSRASQSDHVTIKYNNIDPKEWGTFQPHSKFDKDVTDFGFPYDYGSIMHYKGFAFATNKNKASIQTTDPRYQATIGQREYPSFIDFGRMNAAYCRNYCPEKITCYNGGYSDPNNCVTCKCPTGFGGVNCADAQPTRCGGVVNVDSSVTEIFTPNHPSNFIAGENCYWMIHAQAGEKVHMKFTSLLDYSNCRETCEKSFLEIKTHRDVRKSGFRMCCKEHAPARVISDGETMLVMHIAQGPVGAGFKAQVWSGPSPTDTPIVYSKEQPLVIEPTTAADIVSKPTDLVYPLVKSMSTTERTRNTKTHQIKYRRSRATNFNDMVENYSRSTSSSDEALNRRMHSDQSPYIPEVQYQTNTPAVIVRDPYVDEVVRERYVPRVTYRNYRPGVIGREPRIDDDVMLIGGERRRAVNEYPSSYRLSSRRPTSRRRGFRVPDAEYEENNSDIGRIRGFGRVGVEKRGLIGDRRRGMGELRGIGRVRNRERAVNNRRLDGPSEDKFVERSSHATERYQVRPNEELSENTRTTSDSDYHHRVSDGYRY